MEKYLLSIFMSFIMALAVLGAPDRGLAALSQEDLDGTYNAVGVGAGESDLELDTLTVTFNGDGTWETIESSGEYEISADGLLTVEITEPALEAGVLTSSGAVSPDTNIIVLPETGSEPSCTVLLSVDSSVTATDLAGKRYNYSDFSAYEDGGVIVPELSAGYIDINSDGSALTVYEEYISGEGTPNNSNGYNEYGPIGFTVQGDGTISAEGGSVTGYIGQDGEVLIIYKQNQGVIFLTEESNCGLGALYGNYNLASFGLDTDDWTSAWVENEYPFMDGNGAWSISGGESGTYEINSEGRLTISVTAPAQEEITSYGAVSPEGNLFIIPDMDTAGEVSIALGVKITPPAVQVASGTATSVTSSSTAKTDVELQDEYSTSEDFQPFSEVFNFTAATGESLNEFNFETSGLAGSVADLTLLKLKSGGNLEFNYAAEAETTAGSYVDGTWWIMDENVLPNDYKALTDTLDPNTTYTLHFVIQDDGDFDIDTDSGEIEDPAVLGASVNTSSSSSDDGDDSSSGCFINTLAR